MSYEVYIALGYGAAVACKVLIPPHPHSRICRLLAAEAELFTTLVPCPHFPPPAAKLPGENTVLAPVCDPNRKPSQYMFVDQFQYRHVAPPVVDAKPLEIYG